MTVNVEQYKFDKLFERIQNARKEWNDGDHVRTYYSGTFYNGVYGMQHKFSGYISGDALNAPKNKIAYDHFLSARLIFRAMMGECPELLHDYDGLYSLVSDCQTTIKITRDQNNGDIKFRQRSSGLRIKALTVEKYDDWKWYYQDGTFLTETVNGIEVPAKFPLKHMVPDWLTSFERKHLCL
jgi:hypothetical protein